MSEADRKYNEILAKFLINRSQKDIIEFLFEKFHKKSLFTLNEWKFISLINLHVAENDARDATFDIEDFSDISTIEVLIMQEKERDLGGQTLTETKIVSAWLSAHNGKITTQVYKIPRFDDAVDSKFNSNAYIGQERQWRVVSSALLDIVAICMNINYKTVQSKGISLYTKLGILKTKFNELKSERIQVLNTTIYTVPKKLGWGQESVTTRFFQGKIFCQQLTKSVRHGELPYFDLELAEETFDGRETERVKEAMSILSYSMHDFREATRRDKFLLNWRRLVPRDSDLQQKVKTVLGSYWLLASQWNKISTKSKQRMDDVIHVCMQEGWLVQTNDSYTPDSIMHKVGEDEDDTSLPQFLEPDDDTLALMADCQQRDLNYISMFTCMIEDMQPLAFTASNERGKTMLSSVATVRPQDDEEQSWKDCMKMKRKMVKAMLVKNCHINALIPCQIKTEGRRKDTRKTFLGLFNHIFTAKDAERHPCVEKTREKFQVLGAKTEPEEVQQYCLG
tara:strand:- start:688 stop:2211 length:1524 start_codon:yes stop_codon:yes gene_type:complete